MITVAITHIELDEQGVAWVSGTRTKVLELIVDKIAHGSTPEEMSLQYPHLTLGQIHAALAYYYENQERLDDEIARREREVEALIAESPNRLSRKELLGKGNDLLHRVCSFGKMGGITTETEKPERG